MRRRDLDQPHPLWAAVQVAVGSGWVVDPWWTGHAVGLAGVVLIVLVLLAGLAALGYAALNCLAMWEAPPGGLSMRVLVAAFGLSVFWAVALPEDSTVDRAWGVSVLPAVYAAFVAGVAWREHHRGHASTTVDRRRRTPRHGRDAGKLPCFRTRVRIE